MKRYSPKEIEPKWQKIWEETNVYTSDLASEKPKYIAMSMFNYPSGNLHIGHAMNFTISDVKARYKRQQGYESYHPVGWDSFGLPAENRAIKVGMSPQESMAQLIPDYRKAYKAMGWSNDWSKEISTHSPEYYKWTQWIFSEMYRNKLAYQDVRMQWWCTKCQTVLANEQVIDGKCWRHDGKDDPIVEKKEVKQWFFKITEYADELLEAIDDLDWTESVKLAQKNWIGRSVGAEITFQVCHPEFDSESRGTARSYIMGQQKISKNDIEVIGGTVIRTTDTGHLCVEFPISKSQQFEDLIIEKMEPGFWNEYIADEIVFIFKHKDGKIERFVLSDETEDAIRKLGQSFNDQEDDSNVKVIDWLRNNEWYKDWILNQGQNDGSGGSITVFTTRADTLFGATFLVIAPESDIVSKILTDSQKQSVEDYVKSATKKTEIERQAAKEKTGVFTGSYAINPVNNKKIPIWVADYVLSGYGTGAIMAVPAHDERDNEFAKKFDLPIVEVVAPDFGIPLEDSVDVTGPVVIGFDPNTGEFMSLINTKNDMRWLASGGLNEGEDYETAALRELKEESGYSDVKKLIQLGGPTYSYYYNSNKDSNRRSFSYMYLAILDKNKVAEQSLESHEQYKVEWGPIEDIINDFEKEPEGRGHWIDGMKRAKQASKDYLEGRDYSGPIFTGEGVLFNSTAIQDEPSSEASEVLRFVDVDNPHQEGKKLVERNVVTCIVKHPTEEKYIIARPTKGGPWSPLMGGIDEGESAVDAARRELIEETGFVDISLIEKRGDKFVSEFFAKHKDVNRIANCNIVYIELGSLKSNSELAIEADQQEIKWVTETEYKKLPGTGGMHHVFETAVKTVSEQKNVIYDGMTTSVARERIVADLARNKQATEKVNYKMRDWSVSRQRYWGAPIPIVNCDKCGIVLVPDDQLPVVLPELTDFKPSGDGRSALARATDWLKTTCPDCGGEAERETDTLDTYICSSWYMFRYFDPFNENKIFDSEIVNKWAPIDFYNGGDHATAHLLYARFIARFFTKIGLVDNPEPFKQMLFNGKVVASDGQNFSKTLGNGPDPLEIINQGYGADALRTYLMFAAPLELGSRWDPQGVPGAHRFLVRLWNLVQEYLEADKSVIDPKLKAELARSSAIMIKKVDEDLEGNRYNTAIAATMAGLNDLYNLKNKKFAQSAEWKTAIEAVISSVAPFAPHIADELWQQLGHSDSVHKDSWPKLDMSALVETEVKIVVQVNGKVRSTVIVPTDSDEAAVTEVAKADVKVAVFLKDTQIKKTILVPNKLINFVV